MSSRSCPRIPKDGLSNREEEPVLGMGRDGEVACPLPPPDLRNFQPEPLAEITGCFMKRQV